MRKENAPFTDRVSLSSLTTKTKQNLAYNLFELPYGLFGLSSAKFPQQPHNGLAETFISATLPHSTPLSLSIRKLVNQHEEIS